MMLARKDSFSSIQFSGEENILSSCWKREVGQKKELFWYQIGWNSYKNILIQFKY